MSELVSHWCSTKARWQSVRLRWLLHAVYCLCNSMSYGRIVAGRIASQATIRTRVVEHCIFHCPFFFPHATMRWGIKVTVTMEDITQGLVHRHCQWYKQCNNGLYSVSMQSWMLYKYSEVCQLYRNAVKVWQRFYYMFTWLVCVRCMRQIHLYASNASAPLHNVLFSAIVVETTVERAVSVK